MYACKKFFLFLLLLLTASHSLSASFVVRYGYAHDSSLPHAVTGITEKIATQDQDIEYNDAGRATSIGGNVLDIMYGTGEQRVKSVLAKPSGTLIRYYMGNYEEETGTASHDPWGNRRNPENWAQRDTRTAFLFHRGYTMHEHLPEFNLINMNGRVYDPLTSIFLSPDPYVQAPGNWLNYNRYAYCMNNPLIYTDPDGEFWHLIIGAAIGGVVNWATHGFRFDAKGLGYFGVGALAGALGAGVGAGISSSLAGGSFGAGFIGSSTALTATSSFVTGAAIGGGAGFSSGFVTGLGNGLLDGQNFGQALWSGTKGGIIGGLSGAAIGGLVGGIDAYRHGRDFWDGFDYQKALDNAVLQDGINNPNSKFLVANKKNAQLVNDTYNTNIKVSGNKIYMSSNEYSEYGVNFGTQSKGNITLISKQVIRDKAYNGLTDVIRHEGTHQLQVLAGQTARNFAQARAMEYGAYMTNILNPATHTTIQKAFNYLVNDWMINSSTLWETIFNLYPYGPIP